MTERTGLKIQVAKITFLCRVAGLSLKYRVRNSDICRELGVELLEYCAKPAATTTQNWVSVR